MFWLVFPAVLISFARTQTHNRYKTCLHLLLFSAIADFKVSHFIVVDVCRCKIVCVCVCVRWCMAIASWVPSKIIVSSDPWLE